MYTMKEKNTAMSNSVINGESINYCFVTALCPFIYFTIARIFSLFIDENICRIAAVAAVSIFYFFALDKLVFIKSKRPAAIRILLYIVQCAADIGIFYGVSQLLSLLFEKQNLPEISSGLLSFLLVTYGNFYFSKLVIFKSTVIAEHRKNGRLYRLFYANRFVVLAALLAAFIMLFVYFCYDAYPFGDTSILRMDLYHQYGPLFGELYDRTTALESFQYSWQSGGGGNFLGNFFNYLSSPINFIIFLFKRETLINAISVIILIKAVLSAGSFTLYLRLSQKKHSFLTAGFGLLYAFCGFFLAYYWNVMWLDALYLLPMIALGIEKIIRERKFLLYTVSLALLMFSSYYMSFILCIFSVLYFLVYYFSNFNPGDKVDVHTIKNEKAVKLFSSRFFSSGITFAYASVLSAMVSAVALLPTYFALQSCSATSDAFPKQAELYFDFFDFLGSHTAALETTIRSSGGDVLPNIYSGVIVLILVPLFMMNKSIRLREKAAYTLLLGFFAVSFNSNIMNFMWHAFHFPNDLPYRFSFLYTFIILIVSFKLLTHLKSISQRDIFLVGMLAMFFIALEEKLPNKYFTEGYSFFISVAFVMIYVLILAMMKRKTFKASALAGIMLIAMFSEVVVASTNSYAISQSVSAYTGDYTDTQEQLRYIEEKDDGLYRVEKTNLRTRMDPSWFGYNGVSTFSSMAYQNLSQLQYSLGMFGNRLNSYTYNPQTPLYNAMFSLKYFLWKDDCARLDSQYYTLVNEQNDNQVSVYENNYVLPLAFAVDPGVKDWMYEEGNPFNVQESFFATASGIDEKLFNSVPILSTSVNNLDGISVSGNGTFVYEKTQPSVEAAATLNLKADKDASIYLYITSRSAKAVDVTTPNGSFHQNIEEPYILDIGYHEAGEMISVQIDVGNQDSGSVTFYAYSMDDAVFQKGFSQFSNNSVDFSEHTSTHLKGTINSSSSKIMYTSIPYDESWRVTVDGEEVETFRLANSLLAFNIGEGVHTVEFKYHARGLLLGGLISCCGLTLLATGVYVERLLKRKREVQI